MDDRTIGVEITSMQFVDSTRELRKAFAALRAALVDEDGWSPAATDQIVRSVFSVALAAIFQAQIVGHR